MRLLQSRFGPLPVWVEARLQVADLPTLELWSERTLTVSSLEALFDAPLAGGMH